VALSEAVIARLRHVLIEGRGGADGFANAMAEIAQHFGAHQAMAFVPSHVTDHGFAIDFVGWRSQELFDTAQTFAMTHAEMDPWRIAAEARGGFRQPMIALSEDLVAPAKFSANPWSGFFAEHDIRHLLGYVSPARAIGAPHMAFSLYRSPRQGAFQAHEAKAMWRLSAEIEASAELYLRLAPGAATFDAALEAMTDPAFLIRRGGVMSAANAAGVAMLEDGALLRLEANALTATPPHLAAADRDVLLRALAGESGAANLLKTAHVHLYMRATAVRVDHQIAVVAQVRDAKARRMPNIHDLIAVFDLTHAEADVALGLLQHASARAIAAARETDFETVRTQIRQVYAKLGVRKASEAVAILLRLAE
jgi:DNA-binding CsgD family transcriptional regulator/PAS domain-containing protein